MVKKMRAFHNLKKNIDLRKRLRKESTPQEIILWSRLRRKNFKYRFRRQHSIGNYVVDFYCPEKKLIVEIDGCQHKEKEQSRHDKDREIFLKGLNMKILRFWNDEINNNLEGVILKIEENLI